MRREGRSLVFGCVPPVVDLMTYHPCLHQVDGKYETERLAMCCPPRGRAGRGCLSPFKSHLLETDCVTLSTSLKAHFCRLPARD